MARKNEYTDTIDKRVGAKVHELRICRGLSREQLATKIDVTHQQVQKYEKGINRISVGRMAAISAALSKPLSFFFDQEEEAAPLSQHQRMCIEVSRNFLKIKNPSHQAAVNHLIKTLSKEE